MRNASQSSVSGQNAMLNNCLDQDNKNEISPFEVNTIDRRVAKIQDKSNIYMQIYEEKSFNFEKIFL